MIYHTLSMWCTEGKLGYSSSDTRPVTVRSWWDGHIDMLPFLCLWCWGIRNPLNSMCLSKLLEQAQENDSTNTHTHTHSIKLITTTNKSNKHKTRKWNEKENVSRRTYTHIPSAFRISWNKDRDRVQENYITHTLTHIHTHSRTHTHIVTSIFR